MHRVNTKASGLAQHMRHYNVSDAKMDNPHATSRDHVAMVRAARLEGRDRYRPLRDLAKQR